MAGAQDVSVEKFSHVVCGIFDGNHAKLGQLMKHSIELLNAEMFGNGFISSTVRDLKDFTSTMDEFKASLHYLSTSDDVLSQFKTFCTILSAVGNPQKGAATQISKELSEAAYDTLGIRI